MTTNLINMPHVAFIAYECIADVCLYTCAKLPYSRTRRKSQFIVRGTFCV